MRKQSRYTGKRDETVFAKKQSYNKFFTFILAFVLAIALKIRWLYNSIARKCNKKEEKRAQQSQANLLNLSSSRLPDVIRLKLSYVYKLFALKNFFALFISLLLIASPVFAIKQLVSLQGKITLNGALVSNGNISVTIWDNSTSGNLIYNSSNYFNNSIQSGFFDVMLGSEQDLNLNLSGTYYMDFQVNDVDLDKGGTERLQFQSPVGYKVSGTDNFTVDASTLFVDTLNKKVGIGTSSPTSALHVSGDANVTGSVYSGTQNLSASGIKSYRVYNFSVANSASATTVLNFTVPANDMADGDALIIYFTFKAKNNKGTSGTVDITFFWGATNYTLTSATTWNNAATEQNVSTFFRCQRSGSDLICNSNDGQTTPIVVATGGFWSANYPSFSGGTFGLTVPRPTFTTDSQVGLNVTLSAADATFYWKTGGARAVKFGSP